MKRRANVYVQSELAGVLEELERGSSYSFQYEKNYNGEPVSLSMPVRAEPYQYNNFPPFFDGVLPEGIMLEALIKIRKVDRDDYFSQLCIVGNDLVGGVTVEPVK